jgi:hypothetical protein
MEIAPIPNLIPMRVSAPSAAPPDVPSTRAIDFRRQQDQDEQNQDDATYTPSGSEEEKQHSGEANHSVFQILQAATETILDELDDSGEQHTISVFA